MRTFISILFSCTIFFLGLAFPAYAQNVSDDWTDGQRFFWRYLMEELEAQELHADLAQQDFDIGPLAP